MRGRKGRDLAVRPAPTLPVGPGRAGNRRWVDPV